MRIKLKLRIFNKTFPFNYNYHFSSMIYSILRTASEEFAGKLHDEGFKLLGKTYKLFTFAFRLEKAIPCKGHLELLSPRADLFISSPLVEDFMSNIITGILKIKQNQINITESDINFKIEKFEILEDLNFYEETNFRLLSPMVLSTKKKLNGNLYTYYLRYDDRTEEINRILTSNLRNKYKILNNKDSEGNVELSWDMDYISKRLEGNKYLSSKITIDPNKKAIDIIGINIPFKLKGDTGLIKTGYECGFGEKNSMGFGMAEAV